jgi:protein SCO1/2|tara:strand:- start:2850 stop:3464 length:615 start_codon:yes stop_codon:yes gene_type:complete
MNPILSATAIVLVVVAGFTSLWLGTDRWAAWTAESARRLDVLQTPRMLPNIELINASGDTVSLRGGTKALQIIDFIYTQCPTICLAMGAEFRTLQTDIVSQRLAGGVELLSITFDLVNDDVPALSDYLNRFSAERSIWQAARVVRADELPPLLRQLGVIALPEPTLGFVHNAALYLVDDGQVVEIFDVGDRNQIIQAVQWRLRN